MAKVSELSTRAAPKATPTERAERVRCQKFWGILKFKVYRSIASSRYLSIMLKFVNIQICYGYLNKIKEPLVSDT